MQNDYRLIMPSSSQLRPGDHACCIYANDDEHTQMMSAFLMDAIREGQKCVYLYESEIPNHLIFSLEENDPAAEQAFDRRQLEFLSCQDAYLAPGVFDPELMLGILSSEIQKSIREGYPFIRITGEMGWAAADAPGSERLIEYEARINELPEISRAIILCQYDRRRFDPMVIMDVLLTHPRVAVGNQVYDNSYFLPPEIFLSKDPGQARLDQWLNVLKVRNQRELEIEQTANNLSLQVNEYRSSLAEVNQGLVTALSRYKLLFDSIADAVFVQDVDGRFLQVNQAACELYGYSTAELVGRKPTFLLAPELAQSFVKHMNFLRNNHDLFFETVHLHRNGRRIPVEVHSRNINYEGQPGILSIVRDISERKRIEDVLRQSELKFRSMIENASDGFVLFDEAGNLAEANPAACEIYGIPFHTARGLNYWHIHQMTAPNLAVSDISYQNHDETAENFFKTGEAPWLNQTEEREIRLPNGEARYIQSTHFSIPTARGHMLGSVIRDITAHHKEEVGLEWQRQQLERMVNERTVELQSQIYERQKYEERLEASLAEKEVMLREIHHRVKNNLNIMIALIDLQKAVLTDPQVAQIFNDLHNRTYTMALVHETLYRSPNLAQIDFANYLETLGAYLASNYSGLVPVSIPVEAENISVKIEVAIPCGLIVNELVTNAIKYAFPPEWIGVKGCQCEVKISMRSEDKELILTVADNGVGFPPGFDWETPATLGLQLVQVLVRQLGGKVDVASGNGVTWRISLLDQF